MSQFYCNEIDPYAAEWLRELMKAGQIPSGEVDERSIKDLDSIDVDGPGERHFFAGIGGWPLALRLAGWPAERSVWTGSCPCQPYSSAGKQKGNADERDLWPDFFRLIRKCRPDTVFGEQVEGAIRHGWLDRICADLEGEGYAVGHCVLGAHSVGSPHIRQRLYWVANSKSTRRQRWQDPTGQTRRSVLGTTGGLGHTSGTGLPQRVSDGRVQRGAGCTPTRQATELSSPVVGLGNSNGSGPFAGIEAATTDGHGNTSEPTSGGVVGVVNTPCRREATAEQCGRLSGTEQASPWSDYRIIQCRDGKARRIPIEPEFFPLAYGVPGRVVRLRGYGNAICVQTAAAFVRAFLETEIGAS